MFWSISKHADKSKSSWFCYLGVKILLISLRELSEFPWNSEKLFSSKFQVLEIFRKQGNFDLISVNSKKGKYFILSAFWILKTFMPRKVQRKGFLRCFLVSFIFRGRQITVHSIVMATCLLQSWMRRDLKVTFRKSRHVLYHGLYSKSVKITWKAKKGKLKGNLLKDQRTNSKSYWQDRKCIFVGSSCAVYREKCRTILHWVIWRTNRFIFQAERALYCTPVWV